ncbi:MAG TPA: AAA family ATPase [Gemmataceae bacterium]|jgi:putative ATP-dependent endonuclease of OLD family|nr:AAA family ATPase [Gemmataceae bacterium]
MADTPSIIVPDAVEDRSIPSAPKSSGVLITTVRVFNFRCLREAEFPLSPTTVLIGENNAGKTSFLEALHAAIGIGQRHFGIEDIWIDSTEKHAPKSRAIIVDVLIRPVDDEYRFIDTFATGSPWLELWGNGIQQDDQERDFAAIRTQFAWSPAKGEYLTERKFLREWTGELADAPRASLVERIPPVTISQSTPVSLYLLDAKRDGAEDIRSRSSIWHKLVAEPGLADEHVRAIEALLTQVNEVFVRESKVLSHVKGHLTSVGDVVNCDKDAITIDPVARRLRDLSKGMDVILSTVGASAFPLARQGMGTRSLASVLMFRAYMSWKLSERRTEAIHPFLAIEEPETHLHPHAQRSLFGQIQQIPGQRIISTHSPYICSHADIRTFLHFGKVGSGTRIDTFDVPGDPLTPEEMRKINRGVMNTRGDLLFSRFIVLFEGETEEQALPAFAHLHWGLHPHEVGFSFVAVQGAGGYTPFLRLAIRFGIPWCIFSDGAVHELSQMNGCLERVSLPDHTSNDRVFVVPAGADFEGYLSQPTHLDLIRDMFLELAEEEHPMNERGRQAARERLGRKTASEIAEQLRSRKTTHAARIAGAYAKHADEAQRIPPLVRKMLDFVRPPTTPTTPTTA